MFLNSKAFRAMKDSEIEPEQVLLTTLSMRIEVAERTERRLMDEVNLKEAYLVELNTKITKSIIERDTLERFVKNLKASLWFKLFFAKILGIEYELKTFVEVEDKI